ncbi:MAG: AAA family ATPase [Deltaproteobacteria bacterium]|nr:AAA family ATPase [Deltaproteobacteria bacterium]
MQRLLFSCHERRGAIVLTGEYGCGKTLLSRVLIRELAKDIRCQIALITNPRLGAKEFLATICFELGASKENLLPSDKVGLLDQMKQILESNLEAGRQTTLMIDEAQAIENEEVLEEVRLLMNMQSGNQLLLNVVFIGQPELKEKILKLQQLAQRVQMWFHLPPLDRDETQKYIRHRIHIAGIDSEIFTPEACQKVFALTGGTPRLISNVCNMALWIGEKAGLQQIDVKTVAEASDTLKG